MTGHFTSPFLEQSLFLRRIWIYFYWHCLKWKLFVWFFNSHRFLACIQPCWKKDLAKDKLTTTGRILKITLSDLHKDDLPPEQVWCKLKNTSATRSSYFNHLESSSQPPAKNRTSYRICLPVNSRVTMAKCAADWYHTVSQNFASQHAIPFCSTAITTRKKH